MKWYNLPQDAPKVWQALVNVNTEMTQLMPWLLAKRQSEDTITLHSPFAAWSRQVDNRRILIVVNLVSKPADLKLELSAFGPVALYDWVTGQTVPTEGDTFTTQYSGYHVGIYEIRHTDPVMLTEPVVQEKTWFWRPEIQVEHYGCEEEQRIE